MSQMINVKSARTAKKQKRRKSCPKVARPGPRAGLNLQDTTTQPWATCSHNWQKNGKAVQASAPQLPSPNFPQWLGTICYFLRVLLSKIIRNREQESLMLLHYFCWCVHVKHFFCRKNTAKIALVTELFWMADKYTFLSWQTCKISKHTEQGGKRHPGALPHGQPVLIHSPRSVQELTTCYPLTAAALQQPQRGSSPRPRSEHSFNNIT